MLYKLLSLLLDYPDAQLLAHLDELREAVDELGDLSERDHSTLHAFIDHLAASDATDVAAAYVGTFDMAAEHSLHLTHHLFGDDKNRGPALIDLGEYYKNWGLTVADNELPDYLPLLLEFASTLDEQQATVFLGDMVKVLGVLADNLERAESPYAPLVRIVEKRGHLSQLPL